MRVVGGKRPPSRRPRKARPPWRGWMRAERPARSRPRVSPKLLVVGLILGGAAGFILYDLPPGTLERIRLWPSDGQTTFHLCYVGLQRNCVIDGDTIRYGGDKVRLAGIDTPEIFSPKCEYEKTLGERAKLRLLELLNSGSVDVVRAGQRNKDRYGRLLRIVEVDGRSVGDVLVSEGLARRWSGRRFPWC